MPLRFKSQVSPEAADLISRCLVKDPSFRISSNDLLKHPFFWEKGFGVNTQNSNPRVFQSSMIYKLPPKILDEQESPSPGVEQVVPPRESPLPSSALSKFRT
jgi:serine/threonine protein kinase